MEDISLIVHLTALERRSFESEEVRSLILQRGESRQLSLVSRAEEASTNQAGWSISVPLDSGHRSHTIALHGPCMTIACNKAAALGIVRYVESH